MLRVKRIVNQPVTSNCFVVYHPDARSCVVVDPGDHLCDELLYFLEREKLIPKYIILTHQHFDHIWGVERLKREFQKAQIVCSQSTSQMICDSKKNCSLFYNQIGFTTPPADIIVANGDTIDFEGREIKFFEMPGHSSGSILILIEGNLFTGDTLIKDERTVVKLPGSSKRYLLVSIEKIELLKGSNYTVRAGHGPSFALDDYDLNKAL